MLYECELVPETYLISWCWRWTSGWHRPYAVWVWTCPETYLISWCWWWTSVWHRTVCCVSVNLYCIWDLPDKLVLKVDQRVAQNRMLYECEFVPKTYLISWCWRWTSRWHRPYALWVWTWTGNLPDKLVLKVDQRVAQTICCMSVNFYPRLTW